MTFEPNLYGSLTSDVPATMVATGVKARLTDATGAQTLNLAAGGALNLTGATGNNRINIDGEAGAFSASRSGAQVTLTGSDGTELVVTARDTAQTLAFADGAADLRVADGTVRLGGQTIGETSAGLDPAMLDLDGDTTSRGVFEGGGDRPANPVVVGGDVYQDGAKKTASLAREATNLKVGKTGTGTVTASDGTKLRLGGESNPYDTHDDPYLWAVQVGAESGSSGDLTVRGPRTEVAATGRNSIFSVGDRGEGTLVVEDGATTHALDYELGNKGTGHVTVRGHGSQLLASTKYGTYGEVYPNSGAYIGVANDGEASLKVVEGGTVRIHFADFDGERRGGPGLNIGDEPGSDGSVTVAGLGSRLEIQQAASAEQWGPYLYVGRALGNGELTIRDDGVVRVRGEGAHVRVAEARPSEAESADDASLAGSGTLTVESGGKLRIVDPSQHNWGGLTLAKGEPNADGDVTVTGNGSLISVRKQSAGGAIQVGQDGTGTMKIANGGRVELWSGADAGFPQMNVGDGPESQGTVTLTGADSTLSIRGGRQGELNVGSAGTGTVTMGDGATAHAGALHVGRQPASTGTVELRGAETRLELQNAGGPPVIVGESGDGSLTIENGASVLNNPVGPEGYPHITAGYAPGSSGSIVVGGPGSSLALDADGSGRFRVGRAGTGELTVENGGRAEADQMFVGQHVDSQGSVVVDGADSMLRVGHDKTSFAMLLGARFNTDGEGFDPGGSATVTVRDQATLRAGAQAGDGKHDILVGGGSTLRVESGGTVIGDVRVLDGGTFEPGNSPGIARIGGDADLGGSVTFEIAGAEAGRFDQIRAEGELALEGHATIAFDPAFDVEAGDRFAIARGADGVAAEDLTTTVTGLRDDLAVEVLHGTDQLTLAVLDSPVG